MKLLDPDPKSRIELYDALNHPWFAEILEKFGQWEVDKIEEEKESIVSKSPILHKKSITSLNSSVKKIK